MLELDRKADDDSIKKAYRRLALLHHPDKQSEENRERATAHFQLISEAYEVLSDKQERAWYDSHREQILHSGESAGSGSGLYSTKEDIWRYFSTSCFNGKFDDSDQGFYRVYGDLFEELSRLERDDCDSEEEGDYVDHLPTFGLFGSEFEDVCSFYANWTSFSTMRAFYHFDKWNPREGENRQIRRAMDAENKKARAVARRDYSLAVRSLVAFVKRRDLRVIEHQSRQRLVLAEKAALEAARLELLKETQRKSREIARLEEIQRWNEQDRIRRENGEHSSHSESNDKMEYVCIACRKTFKSEASYMNHENSKKHKLVIAQLRRELLLSDDEQAVEHTVDAPQTHTQTTGSVPTAAPQTHPHTQTAVAEAPQLLLEGSDDEPVQPTKVKARRRRPKEERNKSVAVNVCKVCDAEFPSKSLLFKHLDSFGHHAVK